MRPRLAWMLAAGVAVATALVGCRGEGAPETGVARVVVRAAGDITGIARVTVRVSRGGGSDFAPVVVELPSSGEQWMARVQDVPAGRSRRFDVVAHDAAGAERMTGWATADIQARAATLVAITMSPSLGQADINVSRDDYPVIQALRAVVKIGATMEGDLAVEAIDPDGDPLLFEWSSDAPDGCAGIVFTSAEPYGPGRPHVSLPIPAAPCKVQVTVRDGRASGGTVAAVWLPPGASAGPSRASLEVNP